MPAHLPLGRSPITHTRFWNDPRKRWKKKNNRPHNRAKNAWVSFQFFHLYFEYLTKSLLWYKRSVILFLFLKPFYYYLLFRFEILHHSLSFYKLYAQACAYIRGHILKTGLLTHRLYKKGIICSLTLNNSNYYSNESKHWGDLRRTKERLSSMYCDIPWGVACPSCWKAYIWAKLKMIGAEHIVGRQVRRPYSTYS